MKHLFLRTTALVSLSLLAACGGGSANETAQTSTAVAAQGTSTGVTQPSSTTQPLTDFSIWAQRLMADRMSPVAPGSADLTQTWVGADGKTANVVVRAPRTAGKTPVAIALPAAGDDATPIFESALAKLKAQGGGVLQVAAGEYHFKTLNKSGTPGLAHLFLNKLSDVDIQAAGATFVFEAKDDGFFIQDCQRVRIQGVTMRDGRVLSGYGRMHAVAGGMTLQLDNPLPPALTINWIRPMNETEHTWPNTNVRAIIDPATAQPVRIDDRTFQSPLFSPFADNQFVSVKFTYYGDRAIYIRDSDTATNDDIILDGVHIGTMGGMGVLVRSRGRGVAVVNSTISAQADQPHSTNYDGIHVVASAGDILIRNNAIAHTGDDQINLRAIIHKVSGLSTDGATLSNEARLIRTGDEVAFFDVNGDYIGRRFVSTILTTASADTRSFTFTTGGAIDRAVYARVVQFTPRRFAVVGNTMEDSIGRGMLLQIPNGLVEGNRINRLPRTAIRMFTSYQEWQEGAGAINVRVSGNTIERGGVETGRSYPFGIITAASEAIPNRLAPNYQHGPILIENNKFIAPTAACVMVYVTKDAAQQGNQCGG